MSLLAVHLPSSDSVTRVYALATGQWWGCNWQTKHGPRKLNLHEVRSRQARLIAEATSGDESNAWDQAARYLTQLESDAKAAEKAAAEAISRAKSGHWPEALAAIEVAVTLESKYRLSVSWKPLRDEIASKIDLE